MTPGAADAAATSGPARSTVVALAAQRLATGDISGASALLPGFPPALLKQHYADAFHHAMAVCEESQITAYAL